MIRAVTLALMLLFASLGLLSPAASQVRAAWVGDTVSIDHRLIAPRQDVPCGRVPEAGEVYVFGWVPAAHGTARIPELDLTVPITGGCFEFRNLVLPRDPMLISIEITAEGYRPATWANYIVLSAAGGGPTFTPTLHPGTEPEIIDPCPTLLAHAHEQSAADQIHAELCAQLQLPATGTGVRAGGGTLGATALLLALAGGVGVALAFGLAVLRGHERANRSW
jgi:hypothetical protein